MTICVLTITFYSLTFPVQLAGGFTTSGLVGKPWLQVSSLLNTHKKTLLWEEYTSTKRLIAHTKPSYCLHLEKFPQTVGARVRVLGYSAEACTALPRTRRTWSSQKQRLPTRLEPSERPRRAPCVPPSWPPVRCAGHPCRSVDGVERTRAGQRRFFVNTAKGPEAHHEVSLSARSNFEYNIADLLALAMFSAPRTGLTRYLTPLKAFGPCPQGATSKTT